MQYRVTAVIDAVNLAPLIEALVPLSGKPLQVSALGRKDWNLSSDWYHWTFVASPRETK